MEYSTSIVLSIVAIILCLVWWIKSKVNEKRRNLPKTPSGILTLMFALLLDERHKRLAEYSKRNEGMFTLKVFHKEFIILNSWESMKEALVTQSENFSERPYIFMNAVTYNNTDIIFSNGPVWKQKRRFITHHYRNLGMGKSSMEQIIHDELSNLITNLEEKDGQEMEINYLLNSVVLNILWCITAGKTYKYDDPEMTKLLKLVNSNFDNIKKAIIINIFPFLRHLPGDPFSFWALLEEVETKKKFYESEVDEHIRTFQKEDLRDFIDIYIEKILENKEGDEEDNNNNLQTESCFQKKHLVGALDSLFSAGTETTSTTLEWTFMYMAMWPETQTKVQQELDTVIGRHRRPSYADRKMLPYTEATIMEIQRYSSMVPFTYHSAKFTTKVQGYTIPEGVTIFRNIWAVHHDPDIWGDPEVFRPQRFLNSQGKVQKSEYVIPYSTGTRNCLGESLARVEVFLIFTCLLQSFTFHCVTGKAPPDMKPIETITLRPKPFSLTVRKR